MIRFLFTTQRKSRKSHAVSRGFTLIEMMVALSLFAIVMTISIGTLLIMVDINAKAQAVYSASTNLSYALDTISREIRMGSEYYCSNYSSIPTGTGIPPTTTNIPPIRNCDPGNAIAFTPNNSATREEYATSTCDGNPLHQCIKQRKGNGGWADVTSDEVNITKFEIITENTGYSGSNDFSQPVVTLRIGGEVYNGLDVATTFNVQTRIVQHVIDK